jgi:mannose/fructose/N-acetylgalactosamine-specific phosphotransferase system component IIC
MNNRKRPWASKINIVQVISTAILIVGIFQASPAFAHYAIGLGIAGDVLTVILRSYPLIVQKDRP